MVFFLIILAIVVFFAGFNITNTSDISFGFYTVKSIPIFISLFIAFLAGTLVMIPFISGGKRRKKIAKEPPDPSVEELPSDIQEIDDESKKKSKK